MMGPSAYEPIVKLPAHRPWFPGHASGEQYVSKGSFVHHIMPLDPAYKAGLAGHVPVKKRIVERRGNVEGLFTCSFELRSDIITQKGILVSCLVVKTVFPCLGRQYIARIVIRRTKS